MKEDFKFNLIEFIGSVKESPNSDWSKSVVRVKWGDNPETVDIRNMNMSKNIMGKGISLSNEEADALVNLLLDEDFGSVESIKKAMKRKQNRFIKDDDERIDIIIK